MYIINSIGIHVDFYSFGTCSWDLTPSRKKSEHHSSTLTKFNPQFGELPAALPELRVFTAAMRTRVCEHAVLNKPDCASAQTRGAVETEGWCELSVLTLIGPCGVK